MRQFSTAGSQQGSDGKTVEAAAVRLLAQREHSIDELRRKLLSKGYAPNSVEPVVEKLVGKRLVSDERFTAGFVHRHAKRGHGPVRIRAELRQQGIPEAQIEQELRRSEVDWSRLAGEVRRRKFGVTLPRGLSERAKQSRFLQYRGFDADQIRAALREDLSDDFCDQLGGGAGVTSEADPVDLALSDLERVDPNTDG